MHRQRVVITGLGAVTPVGPDAPSTWEAFVAGKSGLGPITLFDPQETATEAAVVAEVKGFDPSAHFDRRAARRIDRVTQFALVAAREALCDAGLATAEGPIRLTGADPDRIGVFIGSGVGGIGSLIGEQHVIQSEGARRVSPWLLPMFLVDAVPGTVAIEYGLRGPNMAHLSACASGANAIGEAFEAIRRGVADVMVAGGAEAAIVPVAIAGFYNMGALSKWRGEPALASRPFDLERDGFVAGEGAGVLVLESLEHARARGAPIRAEIVGYGATADAVHVTAPAPDGRGMVRAAAVAMAEAGITASAIDHVNAHGTSTPMNDAVETKVVKQLFGDRAARVPVSAIKSMIGHLLGAGGAVEALACVRTIETGILPPTINLRTPDPACDLDYVPNTARHVSAGVSTVLSNSLGFGGHNAALIFRRFD